MISVFVCSRVSGNPNSDLKTFLDSIQHATVDLESVEVLVKIDDDDDAAEKVVSFLPKYPFRVEYLKAPRGRGYLDLHIGYNLLLPLASSSSTIFVAMADDFEVHAGWDLSVKESLPQCFDGMFVIHNRPHPPIGRSGYETEKFYPYYGPFSSFENLYVIDESPFWGRRLIEACGGFGSVSFTDAWTLAIELLLWEKFQINRTVFLPSIFVTRKTCSRDGQGDVRWSTERKSNFNYISSPEFYSSVERNVLSIVEKMK